MKEYFVGKKIAKKPTISDYNKLIVEKFRMDIRREYDPDSVDFNKDNSLIINYNIIKNKLRKYVQVPINIGERSVDRYLNFISHLDTIIN